MGNTGSAQPSKVHKERKKESIDSVGDRPGKNKRASNNTNSRVSKRKLTKHRTTNPFIIFFLRLRSKKPKEHVTRVARAAGKLWTRMSPEQRKKYIDLANAEKKRREMRRKRKKLKRRQ
ncbi:uncharacterized protein LOC143183481 [Calliopsis andreniformis]|uniref:uncharacterized protein LOC143183481 n=1 Tax=Calliopsis andreniformis TaxID=337506 RepID=UPI003FCCB4DA